MHASWARDKLFRFILWGKIFFMSCFEESDISSLKFKVMKQDLSEEKMFLCPLISDFV